MNHHSTWTRRFGVLAAFPLALAMASNAGAQSPDASMHPMESMAPMGSMPAWAVTISGLADGTVVTDNQVTIGVAPTGYTFSCAEAGKPLVDGVGHYHAILDGALIDMECTPTTTISLQNVAPGKHTIIAVPAMNDHEEIQAGAAMVSFDYEPTNPLPEIVAAPPAKRPTIAIVSPAPGTEVSGDFTIQVAVTDFTFADSLFGKPNLDGYGHWHLNVDSTSGPMMGMTTMLGMSGTDTFQASTEGLAPGPHTFYAIVVGNQHAPLMDVAIAQVDLVVK
jgi:hypothetical protein